MYVGEFGVGAEPISDNTKTIVRVRRLLVFHFMRLSAFVLWQRAVNTMNRDSVQNRELKEEGGRRATTRGDIVEAARYSNPSAANNNNMVPISKAHSRR